MPVGIPEVTDALGGFVCNVEVYQNVLTNSKLAFLEKCSFRKKSHLSTVETVNACPDTTKCRRQQPVALLHVHDSNRLKCMRFHVSS